MSGRQQPATLPSSVIDRDSLHGDILIAMRMTTTRINEASFLSLPLLVENDYFPLCLNVFWKRRIVANCDYSWKQTDSKLWWIHRTKTCSSASRVVFSRLPMPPQWMVLCVYVSVYSGTACTRMRARARVWGGSLHFAL